MGVVFRWFVVLLGAVMYLKWEVVPEVVRLYEAEYSRLRKESLEETAEVVRLLNRKGNESQVSPSEEEKEEEEDVGTLAELVAAKEFHKEVEAMHKGFSAAKDRSGWIELEYRRLLVDLQYEFRLLSALEARRQYLLSEAAGIARVRGLPFAGAFREEGGVVILDAPKIFAQEALRSLSPDVAQATKEQVQLSAMLSVTRDEILSLNLTEARSMREDRDKKKKDVARLRDLLPKEEQELEVRVRKTTAAQLDQHPAITDDGHFNATALVAAMKVHFKTHWLRHGWQQAKVDFQRDYRLYLSRLWTQWKQRRYAAWQHHKRHTPIVLRATVFLEDKTRLVRSVPGVNASCYLLLLVADQCYQALLELAVCASELAQTLDAQLGLLNIGLAFFTRLSAFISGTLAPRLRDASMAALDAAKRSLRSAAKILRHRLPPSLRSNAQALILSALLAPVEIKVARSLLAPPVRLLSNCIADVKWILASLLALVVFLVYRLPLRLITGASLDRRDDDDDKGRQQPKRPSS